MHIRICQYVIVLISAGVGFTLDT